MSMTNDKASFIEGSVKWEGEIGEVCDYAIGSAFH
jgi:hypothetical protein